MATEERDLQPMQDADTIDTLKDVSMEELQIMLDDLTNNDPDAPYMVPVRPDASLGVWFKKLIGFGGHFPSGVAIFAIAVIGSVVVVCSGTAGSATQEQAPLVAGMFLGSGLIAQVIDTLGKRRN